MSIETISSSAGGAGALQTHSFSTDTVSPRERYAFWKEAIFESIAKVDIDCRDADRFGGRVQWRRVDFGGGKQAILSEVAAPPLTARRGAHQLARARESSVGLIFQRKGTATTEQSGRNNVLRPGDIGLIDVTQQYRLGLEEAFDHLVLMLPYERLAPLLPAGGHWRGCVVRASSPFGGVLNAHVKAVAAALDRLDAVSRVALLDNTIELVALAFTDELRKFAGDASTVRRALVLRASQYIDRRLADPRLSAVSIAGALGVSAGYLQHSFQSMRTTVGAEIRRRRLERCRDDLADPLRAGEQVGEIAMRWAFSDLPHFSRAFKKQFGLSPREYRAAAAELRARGR